MRNKIFVTRADFHFDLQRFADAVTYIDANCTELTVSNATILTGNETTLNASRYVVNDNITISNTLKISGEVHLILADGKKLTVNCGSGEGISSTNTSDKLNIYCQANPSGELEVTGTSTHAITVYGGITINGGKITANSPAQGFKLTKTSLLTAER